MLVSVPLSVVFTRPLVKYEYVMLHTYAYYMYACNVIIFMPVHSCMTLYAYSRTLLTSTWKLKQYCLEPYRCV